MNAQIILRDGSSVSLAEWQLRNNLPPDKAMPQFSVRELGLHKENARITEQLLLLLQKVRDIRNKSTKINEGFRSPAEARALHDRYAAMMRAGTLNASKNPASLNSPHTQGMAADIDESSPESVRKLEADIRKAAAELGFSIRIGIRQYLGAGMTFVHVDVCPEFFAPGKPFHLRPHPAAWRNPITW
jgi:uncharacterized protein YcbK (DUF882 family)